MSRSLVGFVFDSLEFAREGRSVSGSVPVSALPRLLELLEGAAENALECVISGRRDQESSWLSLKISGQFDMACQRCLGPMPFVVELETELQVIAPGQPWPDEELDDGALRLGADAIAADTAQLLTDLIEEEVLLAVPIAPKHDSDCAPLARGDDKQATSPFAMLAQLKKH